MEDFYDTRIDGVDGEIVGLFGVFDGRYPPSLFHTHMLIHTYTQARESEVSKQFLGWNVWTFF